MPYQDPEADDPHQLVGVSLPGDESSTRQMAEAFAEEFAQLGWSRRRILALFHNPFYAGAHAALAHLGEDEIERIVDVSVRLWGAFRVVVTDTAEEATAPSKRSVVLK